MSYADTVKGSKKIIFNLGDVNKAPELVSDLPRQIMHDQRFDKRFSIYMVEHAYAVCAYNNFMVREYPKPQPKHGVR
jgi:hypothetical protein